MIERRDGVFPEKLSFWVVLIAALGAFMVLIDPMVVLTTAAGTTVKFGGDGFSSELKGAVITIMLIGGWQGVMSFWLGNSDGSQKQAQSMTRIAEASAPVAAAAVAASQGTVVQTPPLKTDTVNVQADTANVTEVPK